MDKDTAQTSSSLIDRVAEAIRVEMAGNRSAHPDPHEMARAAIEAMREPTEGMIRYGGVRVQGARDEAEAVARSVYKAMMATALAPSER